MSNCNNLNNNFAGNNIYVTGSETRTTIEVSNNKSRYYAELAESYKNEAREYCNNARYYAEQNSDVSMNYINNLETTLTNLINEKQDAGEYALDSDIPTNNNQLTNGAGYITGITSSDVTTALTYTPADNNLSNITTTGQKLIDGQWVDSYLIIANHVTWNDSTAEATYSLSSYLPNDEYNYEVIISANSTTVATSGRYISVKLKTDLISNEVLVCTVTARSAAIVNDCGCAILPVGSGRYIKLCAPSVTNASGDYSLMLNGYRRIGTNQ